MKEIKTNLSKHESDLIHKQNKRPETDSCLQKSIEIKNSSVSSIYADCHDVLYG
jgi:hypothetical protein